MKIFDTHAHYDDARFDGDRNEVLNNFLQSGEMKIVNASSSFASNEIGKKLSSQFSNVYFAAGIHPENVDDIDEERFEKIREYALDKRCVAIGEIGLDYHYEEMDKEAQKYWLRKQIALAKELKKPLIIHSRDAAEDTLNLLVEEKASEAGGVIHCFSYSKEMAKIYVEMGFYIGVGGVVTFKNGKKLKEVVESIPLEKIVLETDCPYLSPEPFRGARNDSSKIEYVIEEIAKIKGLTSDEVCAKTWENAHKLYGLKIE